MRVDCWTIARQLASSIATVALLAACASLEDRRNERILESFDIRFTSGTCSSGTWPRVQPFNGICATTPDGGMRINASSRGDLHSTTTVILINDRDEAVVAGLRGFRGQPPTQTLRVLEDHEIETIRQKLEVISVCDLPDDERIVLGGGILDLFVFNDSTGQVCGGQYFWGFSPRPDFESAFRLILNLPLSGQSNNTPSSGH